MDKLEKCAKDYEKLSNTKYKFIIGKKGKIVTIVLSFNTNEFFHLAGLHKLEDKGFSRKQASNVYEDIINRKISFSDISQSSYFTKIKDRFEALCNFEKILDVNEIVFRYNKNFTRSFIEAVYLLDTNYKNEEIYIFLDEKIKGSNECFCKSCFPKEKQNFTLGQSRWTLLYKEKINRDTNNITIQYNKLYDFDIVVSTEEFNLLKHQLEDKIEKLTQTENEITIRSYKIDRDNINKILVDYRENQLGNKYIDVQKFQSMSDNIIFAVGNGAAVLKAPVSPMLSPFNLSNDLSNKLKSICNKIKNISGKLGELFKTTSVQIAEIKSQKHKVTATNKRSSYNKAAQNLKEQQCNAKKNGEKLVTEKQNQSLEQTFYISRNVVNKNAEKIKQERTENQSKQKHKAKDSSIGDD